MPPELSAIEIETVLGGDGLAVRLHFASRSLRDAAGAGHGTTRLLPDAVLGTAGHNRARAPPLWRTAVGWAAAWFRGGELNMPSPYDPLRSPRHATPMPSAQAWQR